MNRELNELLLKLLERYKIALVYKEVYRNELAQLQPQFVGPIRQAHLDAQARIVDPLFLEAEQALESGEIPQHILEGLLEKLERNRM